MNKYFNLFFVSSLSAALLVSCKVTKPYQLPPLKYSDTFRGKSNTDTSTIASLSWKDIFTDTLLQKLILQGIAQNIDLQIAYAHIRQAQAYYLQSRAAFLPNLNSNADVSRLRLSDAQVLNSQQNITQYQLGLSSTWQIDIWGRLSSVKRASFASLLQTEAGSKAVQSGIVSSIATLYYRLVALDSEVIITEQTVKNWDTTVTTMQALKDAARVTQAAVVQSEAQKYAAAVTIPDLKQSIRETENAICVLLGIPPSPIERSHLQSQLPIPILNTGIPAQLLANRPDVQQAELGYRNAFELTNVARTAFYPSITITGSAGFYGFNLSNFFSFPFFFASVGGGLTQPIFNNRLNKTNLEVTNEQQKIALFGFKNTLLIAGQEVSDALSLHETALDKTVVRTDEITALQLSVEYTQELLQKGFANYTEVITARQNLLSAELGGVNDKLQQLQSVVNLYAALGGGWR